MSKRRPRKKTVEYFVSIKNAINGSGEINRKLLHEILSEKYGLSTPRINELIRQYIKEGENIIRSWGGGVSKEKYEIAEVEEIPRTNVERLPSTEEELKAYRYLKILSPEAQAMRLDALNNAITMESGIARIKALELLDEITKEYTDNTNIEEPVFFNVHSTKKTPDPQPEELEED